jgi:hypothetical protein
VYIIHGKVGYEVKVFLGKIKAEKVYDYDVQFDHNDNGAVTNATVTFFKIEGEQRRELGKASFGLKEAARTGLINKDLYKSYPKLMMYYRAASDGIKMYCPDVIKGAVMREDLIEIETVPSKVTMEKKEQENGKETI